MKYRFLLAAAFFCSVPAAVFAENAVFPQTPELWFAMLNSDLNDATAVLGGGYEEINPGDYSSRADRIIYYPEGLTLWASGGKIRQCRLDSIWQGRVGGVSIGMHEDQLRLLMGVPWIEEGSSLYYNLPWNGGPVRLRFVLTDSLLKEIYLYMVR